jgi:hypothetical protein
VPLAPPLPLVPVVLPDPVVDEPALAPLPEPPLRPLAELPYVPELPAPPELPVELDPDDPVPPGCPLPDEPFDPLVDDPLELPGRERLLRQVLNSSENFV